MPVRYLQFKTRRQIAHTEALSVGIVLIEKKIVSDHIGIKNLLVRKLRFPICSIGL